MREFKADVNDIVTEFEVAKLEEERLARHEEQLHIILNALECIAGSIKILDTRLNLLFFNEENGLTKTVEDMEWEEDIVTFCGWSMEKVQDEIHEMAIETVWHEDDDRQEILESLIGTILDNAKDMLLPKYYKQWIISQA
jgi:hypothetical protein